MLPDNYIKHILFELEEIDLLLKQYEDLLKITHNPNLIELTSLASVLHSFYTGIEKIFLVIAKNNDKNVPDGNTWDKDLLNIMTKKNSSRKKIISYELRDQLSQYLIFRHFFRQAYSFHLQYSEIENLVKNIYTVWKIFKNEILSSLELKK